MDFLGGITKNHWRQVEDLPNEKSDNSTFVILLTAAAFIWIVVYQNLDANLAVLYSLLLTFAALLFLWKVVSKSTSGIRVTSPSFGSYSGAIWQLIIGASIGIAFSAGILFATPKTAALIAPLAVLFPLGTLVSLVSVQLLVGTVQPLIEELFYAPVTGLVANIIKPRVSDAFLVMFLILGIIGGSFVPLHYAPYNTQLQQQWDEYQSSVTFFQQNPSQSVMCSPGYYQDVKLNACKAIPPQPDTSDALNALLGMLFWVFLLRVVLTYIEVMYNSIWIAILAHGIYNSIVTAFIILGTPILAVVSIGALLLMYFIWMLSIPKEEQGAQMELSQGGFILGR